jgi:hypothetical protein
MRLRVVLVMMFVALGFAAPALAQSEEPQTQSGLLDLPGMGIADRATRGEVAPSQASKHGDTDAADEPEPSASPDPATEAEAPDTGTITELPGTGGIPTISEQRVGLASTRSEADTMPRGLFAAAALGTILSVGAFFLVARSRLLG